MMTYFALQVKREADLLVFNDEKLDSISKIWIVNQYLTKHLFKHDVFYIFLTSLLFGNTAVFYKQ